LKWGGEKRTYPGKVGSHVWGGKIFVRGGQKRRGTEKGEAEPHCKVSVRQPFWKKRKGKPNGAEGTNNEQSKRGGKTNKDECQEEERV